MTITMGKLTPATTDDEKANYGPLLGFGIQHVRVDPHTHIVQTKPCADLREIADMIRAKGNSKEPAR